MIIKGFVVGVVASAPMGPVGVLCIQRTLNKGRWCGFATGLGAALSDIIYAVITGYGMSFIVDFIENPRNNLWLKLAGSIMLLLFGIYTFKSRPRQAKHEIPNTKGTLFGYFATGFFVTLSNPLIIFLFIALFGQLTFVLPDNPIPQIVGFLFIVVGAVIWWFMLSLLVDKLRKRFDESRIYLINKVIGIVVIVASIGGLITTIFGIALPL